MTQNARTITNNGDFTADGAAWQQNGGTVTGTPVHIATGFQDAGGTGGFVVTGSGSPISGTIGAGQTVGLGIRANEETNIFPINAAGLTVAPGGVRVLQGAPANGLGLSGGVLTVNGTLRIAMPCTASSGGNDRAAVTSGITVGSGGVLDIQADSVLSLGATTGPPALVNNGTVAIAPGAEIAVLLGSTDAITNGAGGTLSFAIASPTRFGRIHGFTGLTALGGAAVGVPTDGFVPAVGAAFKVIDGRVAAGTAIASVGGGFTASYVADGSSASLVYAGRCGSGAGRRHERRAAARRRGPTTRRPSSAS